MVKGVKYNINKLNDGYKKYNLKNASNYLIKCVIESFINKNNDNENNTDINNINNINNTNNTNEYINMTMLSLLTQYIANKNIKELKEYKNESENKFKEIFHDIIVIKKQDNDNYENINEKINKKNNNYKYIKYKYIKYKYETEFKEITNYNLKILKERINYFLILFVFITFYNLFNDLLLNN